MRVQRPQCTGGQLTDGAARSDKDFLGRIKLCSLTSGSWFVPFSSSPWSPFGRPLTLAPWEYFQLSLWRRIGARELRRRKTRCLSTYIREALPQPVQPSALPSPAYYDPNGTYPQHLHRTTPRTPSHSVMSKPSNHVPRYWYRGSDEERRLNIWLEEVYMPLCRKQGIDPDSLRPRICPRKRSKVRLHRLSCASAATHFRVVGGVPSL